MRSPSLPDIRLSSAARAAYTAMFAPADAAGYLAVKPQPFYGLRPDCRRQNVCRRLEMRVFLVRNRQRDEQREHCFERGVGAVEFAPRLPREHDKPGDCGARPERGREKARLARKAAGAPRARIRFPSIFGT